MQINGRAFVAVKPCCVCPDRYQIGEGCVIVVPVEIRHPDILHDDKTRSLTVVFLPVRKIYYTALLHHMKSRFSFSRSLYLCGLVLALAFVSLAQTVPAPKDVLGWTPGDDRKLASWAQVVEYFKKLDAASDRVQFQEIGKSTMGAPFVYATISSPENLKNLEKYKKINAQLADPRTFLSR